MAKFNNLKGTTMNRYRLDIKHVILQLIPFFMNGRIFQLFVRSLLHPLQSVSDAYAEWAFEQKILTNLTSQKIKLEWYLNWKFGKYFASEGDAITISGKNESEDLSPALYHDSEFYISLYKESDNVPPYFVCAESDYPNTDFRIILTEDEADNNAGGSSPYIYRESDREGEPLFVYMDIDMRYSFFVNVPQLSLPEEMTFDDFDNAVCSIIDDYKLVTKTYKILYTI